MPLNVGAAPLFDMPHPERLREVGRFFGVPAYELDVPETISELGYGSHQFFRYYGKFPSAVGREIVRRLCEPGQTVLDVYAGCGTSLVEAQSAGCPSFGLDLNPLAAFACNVKTAYLDAQRLRAARDRVLARLAAGSAQDHPTAMSQKRLDKWFRPETQEELGALRAALLTEPLGEERSFLVLSFLGIVRRVSTAYDGEIRPHVNPKKKPRSATLAFVKKTNEMIEALAEVDALRPPNVASQTVIADNRDPSAYAGLLQDTQPRLMIAHPPYLNSFNYLQVFSLEFAWAEGFEEVWRDRSLADLRPREHIAWPATSTKVLQRYYEDCERSLGTAIQSLAPGAHIAVVIGDATIRGALEKVHVKMWQLLARLGLSPSEIWYRTTHYGIGKYAYRHRADYHGAADKRDAVLIFRAP
jgi:hypothetical protein